MDTVPAPIPAAAAAAATALPQRPQEEEIPLGWECANPALQIECWRTDAASPATVALVIES